MYYKKIAVSLGFITLLLLSKLSFTQQYHALHGSSYAGAASIYNNPASPNNSIHRWHITGLAFQFTGNTNTVYAKNVKLPAISGASIQLTQGTQNRYLNSSFDLNLFNAMYRINKKQSIAVALRTRMYNHIQTNEFNFNDSINSLNEFLQINRTTPQLTGRMTHSGWIEGNLNYSQVLQETDNSRLSGGITVQVIKSISGAYSRVNRVTYLESRNTTDSVYTLTGGVGAFAYSSNYDIWDENFSTQANIRNFIKGASGGLGLSLGIEYILYNDVTVVDERKPRIYDWKLGVSLMDVGSNKFNTSKFTGQFAQTNQPVNDGDISSKLSGITSARDLRDSLASLFDTLTVLPTEYKIGNPTRLILNADKNLGNNFYLNAQMTVHLSSSNSVVKLNAAEQNFLSLTPRWETLNWGLYIPIQYNRQGNFWAGFAIKAGPIIGGIHHIGIFKKDPMLNGGGYILLSIYPFRKRELKSRLDCFE